MVTSVNTAFYPSDKSQEAIVNYTKAISSALGQQWNIREKLKNVDLAYMREQDFTKENTRARIANTYGDSDKFQNITVPVVMPQVEAATTYQASVFLTGTPIFGVASSPEYIDAALQLETIIESQQEKAGWVRELLMFLRDGFKYNLSAIECSWETWNTAIMETQPGKVEAKTDTNKVWAGNRIRRLNMYNTFFDSRVAPSRVYAEGEFAGFTEMMSRIRLKEFINSLPLKINAKEAFESGLGFGGGAESFFVPELNPTSLLDVNPGFTTNWLAWAHLDKNSNSNIQYKDMYEVTTVYAKLLPSDFNFAIPNRGTPQIFKIIVVNQQKVIHIERQTNAHGFLPILIGQPLEDGLDFQTKSLADNAVPFQQVTSAMMNSVIAARRRSIGDRILYDPSRIAEHVINSPNPSARMPVRPSAYGKPVSEAVHAFPFRDDQSGLILQEINTVLALGNEANGQNKARQGQFVKGNKTQREFDSVMANANGRDQMTAISLEAQIFTPLKTIIKTNILQYQGADKIFSKSKNLAVDVDPTQLREAVMEFKISDGLTPTDKLMDADSFTVALQTMGSSPQIGAGYNVTPLFSYLMKQRGADLTPFEKSPQQLAYEQAVAAWQGSMQMFAKQLENGLVKPEQLPPQPLPEQFGYDTASASPTTAPTAGKTTVNNYTNNISNVESN